MEVSSKVDHLPAKLRGFIDILPHGCVMHEIAQVLKPVAAVSINEDRGDDASITFFRRTVSRVPPADRRNHLAFTNHKHEAPVALAANEVGLILNDLAGVEPDVIIFCRTQHHLTLKLRRPGLPLQIINTVFWKSLRPVRSPVDVYKRDN